MTRCPASPSPVILIEAAQRAAAVEGPPDHLTARGRRVPRASPRRARAGPCGPILPPLVDAAQLEAYVEFANKFLTDQRHESFCGVSFLIPGEIMPSCRFGSPIRSRRFRYSLRALSRSKPRMLVCGFLAAVVACAGSDTDTSTLTKDLPGAESVAQTVSLDSHLRTAGCTPVDGRPRYGTIGIFGRDGIARFSCTGVTGEAIRGAIRQFREGQPTDIGIAHSLGGYSFRHYLGSRDFCNVTIWSYYSGTQLTGREVEWHESDCFTVSYFWDEWVPGALDEEIPSEYEGGGGPYYSPTDPERRTPTIDTIADLDHTCDGVDPSNPNKANFKCLVFLSTADSARIYDSVDVYRRPLAQIQDPLQRMECDSLFRWLDDFKEWNRTTASIPFIYAGRTDSVSAGLPQHNGQSNDLGQIRGWPNSAVEDPPLPQLVHLDPNVLTKASSVFGKRQVLETLLHEAAHAWRGIDHDTSSVGYPNDPYFRTLEAGGACIL